MDQEKVWNQPQTPPQILKVSQKKWLIHLDHQVQDQNIITNDLCQHQSHSDQQISLGTTFPFG